jgi:adhesin/invasin
LASGGGVLGGTTTVNTDANGRAQYTDLFISGPAGKKTIIFAAAGHISVTSDSINLALPQPSATRSTVVVTPVAIIASAGSSSSTITVTVRDMSGNLIPGVAVVLAVTGSGNQLGQPGLTDAGGVATGTLSSTVSQSKTISATAGSIVLAQTPTVTVGPGPVQAATSTASVPAGKAIQPTVIVVTARDQWNNRLITGGANVVITVTGANPRTSITAADNGNGTYTAAYLPLVVGQDTIRITLNGTPISGSPFTSTVGP